MAGIGTGFLAGLVLGGATAAAASLLLPAGAGRATAPAPPVTDRKSVV